MRIIASLVGCRAVRYKLDLGLLGKERKMRIGSYQLKNRVLLAPMAGITDQPFRRLCAYYGAGLTFSEMMSTNPQVWHTEKSKLRLAHSEDLGLNAVQIAGSDPLRWRKPLLLTWNMALKSLTLIWDALPKK